MNKLIELERRNRRYITYIAALCTVVQLFCLPLRMSSVGVLAGDGKRFM